MDFKSDVLLEFVPVNDEQVFSPTSSCVQGVSNEDVRQYLNSELMQTMFVFLGDRMVLDVFSKRMIGPSNGASNLFFVW